MTKRIVSIILCISILLSFATYTAYADENISYVKKYLSVKRVNDNYEDTVEVITDNDSVYINVESLVEIAGFENYEIKADTELNSVKLFKKVPEKDTSKSFYETTFIPKGKKVVSPMYGETDFYGVVYFEKNAYFDIIEICNYLRIKICVVAEQLLVNVPLYTIRDFLINDYSDLLNNTVSQLDLLEGEESLEGSSWKDALALACNNFDLKFLVPYFGSKELKNEQYEKAILTLSEDDEAFYTENTEGVLKAGLSDRGISKVLATGKDLANVLSIGGSTIEGYESALEMLENAGKIDSSECAKYMECINWNGKAYDSIIQLRALSKYGKGLSDALSIADIIVSGYETLADSKAWSEESLEDLEVLRNLDYDAYKMESSSAFREFFRNLFNINKAKSTIKTISKMADECYDDSKNKANAVAEEVFEKSSEKILEETITKVHPIGIVVDVFVLAVNTGVSVAKCFGTVEDDIEKGELSYMVSCLINIAVATRIDAENKLSSIGSKRYITNSKEMNDFRKSLNVYIKSNLRCWSYIYYLKSDGSWEYSNEGKGVKEKIDNMNMYLTLIEHTKQYDYALDTSEINTLQHSEIVPILKDEAPSEFKSGTFIEVNGKIISVYDDGIYYKENINSPKKKIISASQVTSMLSDGKVIYYVTYEPTIIGTEISTLPHTLHSVNIDGTGYNKIHYLSHRAMQVLCFKHGYLYWLEEYDYGTRGTLNKINVSTKENINLGDEVIRLHEDNAVGYVGQIGDKLYFMNRNYSGEGRNKDALVSYDLNTEESVVELSNTTIDFTRIKQYDGKMYFRSYTVNDNYYNTNCYVYIIDSNNKLSKSVQIPSDLSVQIIDSNCEYAICFNDEQSDTDTLFDMYRVDLRTGEVITSKGEAGRYKNKSYFVTYDLANPDDIYFMYNVGLYDKETNKIINKKHDEFETATTKSMWIIDGYIVDSKLNTYKIYDEEIVMNDYDWKESYIAYLNNNSIGYEYALVFVDKDDVPELYEHGVQRPSTSKLLWVYEGDICTCQMLIDGFEYIEKENLFMSTGIQSGIQGDFVYTIKGEEAVELSSGTASRMIRGQEKYTWNGEDVSESEYNTLRLQSFDSSKSKTVEKYNSVDEMINLIQNY